MGEYSIVTPLHFNKQSKLHGVLEAEHLSPDQMLLPWPGLLQPWEAKTLCHEYRDLH